MLYLVIVCEILAFIVIGTIIIKLFDLIFERYINEKDKPS